MENNFSFPFIIAEIGANHNGDLNLAKKMVLEAKQCGCNAVKFQLWQKEELITSKHIEELNNGKVKIENIEKWESKELGLMDLSQQIEKFVMTFEQHKEIFEFCKKNEILVSSTPINKEGVDFLLELKANYMKISSMDINNLDLINYTVSTGLPTFISTGLATIGEIEKAVNIIPDKYKNNVVFLHCTSLYPPDDEIINLKFMNTISETFGIKCGYSDHSLGFEIAIAAAALGAVVIEKHFTLDKQLPGWDHKISANVSEMKIICSGVRKVRTALGNGVKLLSNKEIEKKYKFRRSIVIQENLTKGTIVKKKHLTFKRPGTGIQIDEIEYVLGKKLKKDYKIDEMLKWEDLE